MKKVKTVFLSLIAAIMLLTFQPILATSTVEDTSSSIVDPTTENSDEIKVLTERLEEINAMDKSELSFSEKRELRKEVRSIDYALTHPGGIYLSGGALVVVIILVIVLL